MIRTARIVATISVSAACLCTSLLAFAFTIPPNDGLVTDAANILSSDERQKLVEMLTAYQAATSNEIAIVIVNSLEGSPIEDVALEIGRKWGIGSTKNNGILILVSYTERSVRIEVGYGLEGAVPDIVARGIIDTDIVPAFRRADYSAGLEAAIVSLKNHIGGEYTADRYAKKNTNDSPWAFVFFFAFIVFQWGLAVLSRTKSWWLGGVFGAVAGILLVIFFGWWLSIPVLVLLGFFLDYVVSKNYTKRGPTRWWAGGNWGPGGGFGSGSSGGFGGGSFGGGGASGHW